MAVCYIIVVPYFDWCCRRCSRQSLWFGPWPTLPFYLNCDFAERTSDCVRCRLPRRRRVYWSRRSRCRFYNRDAWGVAGVTSMWLGSHGGMWHGGVIIHVTVVAACHDSTQRERGVASRNGVASGVAVTTLRSSRQYRCRTNPSDIYIYMAYNNGSNNLPSLGLCMDYRFDLAR